LLLHIFLIEFEVVLGETFKTRIKRKGARPMKNFEIRFIRRETYYAGIDRYEKQKTNDFQLCSFLASIPTCFFLPCSCLCWRAFR